MAAPGAGKSAARLDLGGIGSATPPPNPAQPIGPDNPADGTGTGKILRRVMNGAVPAEPEEYKIAGTINRDGDEKTSRNGTPHVRRG